MTSYFAFQMHFSTTLALTASLALTQAAALPAQVSPRQATKKWVVTWQDDFNNLENWKCDLGHGYPGGPTNWGTGQIEENTCDMWNVRAYEKTLYLTPWKNLKGQNEWTSSRIVSKKNFQARNMEQVWVEAEIKLGTNKEQQGIWTAFWALGSRFFTDVWNWPQFGEFDILESINGRPLSESSGGLHCGTKEGGPCNEPIGLSYPHAPARNAQRGNFNKYVMVIDRTTGNWKTESLSFSVNGIKTVTIKGADLLARGDSENVARVTWQNAIYQPFNLLLNVAVGGNWPGLPNEKTQGGEGSGMQVKNLKVWNWQ